MFLKILEKICDNRSLFSFLIKRIVRNLFFLKTKTIVSLNATSRPHYAYCVYNAAILAKKLGYKSFSIIEFGVAGGNGIYFLEKFCEKVRLELNIEIEIYGFDLKDGLSNPKDYKDLPYWFQSGFYSMNESELKKVLKKTKLILGDVKETIKKLESLYKNKKYTHKRIWQVGMIMKVRLEVLKDIKPRQYNLSERYFKFLGERTKLDNRDRYKFNFKI